MESAEGGGTMTADALPQGWQQAAPARQTKQGRMMARSGEHRQQAASDAKGKMPPQQAMLTAVFQDNYVMGRTPAGEPFVVDQFRAPSVAVPLKGTGGLRQRLAVDMLDVWRVLPSQEALTAVVSMVEGMCAQVGDSHKTALRVARANDGSIVLDLARRDGLVVMVNGGGWQLCDRAPHPVLFRRSAATPELPVPGQRRAYPAELGALINIRGSDERALYIACRLMSLFPEGTRPVEIITGQPGAIKTGTTRLTVGWLGGAMAAMPRDPRDWVAMAAGAHTLGHDNVSSMSADRQDLLCKAASGHDHLARVLYTDADLIGIKFAPLAIVINGIEVGMLRADLIRRAVSHYLLRPDDYASEREVAAVWEQVHPRALGWLLDLMAAVLARMEQVTAPASDSLHDFAHILAALDSMWGTRALDLWRGGQRELYADLAAGDPVAVAITNVIKSRWEGTLKDLLDTLDCHLPALPPGLSWTPQRLRGKVDRAQAALEALGWKVERPHDTHNDTRRIVLLPPG